MVFCLGRRMVRVSKKKRLWVNHRLKGALNEKREQADCLVFRHPRLPSL